MIQYLHGLRLVHGFDCILCHCPCRKCDKRTACEGTRGTGSRKDKKQQDKRVGRLLNQHKSTRTATGRQSFSVVQRNQIGFSWGCLLAAAFIFTPGADLLPDRKQKDPAYYQLSGLRWRLGLGLRGSWVFFFFLFNFFSFPEEPQGWK